MSMRFDTLLVANRGEIALRILRTARHLGLRTVAVYSDADADSLHVREADLAVRLGPADANASYRHIEGILDACRRSGAQAVHPGYGFLSENPAFAQAVTDAGLVYVGPSAQVIDLMGNKALAKAAMQAAGVPTVPGAAASGSDAEVLAAAERVGFPIILKAAAGGGGRGMRVVRDAAALPEMLRQARSEALGAFGSDEILIERVIEQARHIEIQVLCDEHGHQLHLGERDCSTQRRFQKVIEEAPSPAVDAALRDEMGEIARRACAAIGYTGVGTLEFLLGADRSFYFMEMNTRLQVEHGVTELITRLDLVEQQLRVAQGEALGFTQDEVRFQGHAIELRLCAEDPAAGFMPQVGQVGLWRAAPGIRTDSALESGSVVSPHYDSMVGKLLAHAPTREACLQKLAMACERTVLLGLRSNLGFLARCLRHPVFRAGQMTTGFLAAEDLQASYWQATPSAHARAAATWLLAWLPDVDHGAAPRLQPSTALWLRQAPDGGAAASMHRLGAEALCMQLTPTVDGHMQWRASAAQPANEKNADDRSAVHQITQVRITEDEIACAVDGVLRRLAFHRPDAQHVWLQDGADTWCFERITRFGPADDDSEHKPRLHAPMSGRVIALPVQTGERVQAGQPLVVMESMKMEMPLCAERAGVIRDILVTIGDQLSAGQVLMEIEAE